VAGILQGALLIKQVCTMHRKYSEIEIGAVLGQVCTMHRKYSAWTGICIDNGDFPVQGNRNRRNTNCLH
jgi:hypothetical protein